MSDQTTENTAIRCFGCGDYCDEVFGDGVCSRDCRRKREEAIVGLARSLRRFARRAEVEALTTGIYGCALVRTYYSGSDAGDEAGRRMRAFVDRLALMALEGP